MAGKFSMPRFDQEDLESTQELPQLPEEFDPIHVDPTPDYDFHPVPQAAPEYPADYDPEEEYNPEEELPEDFIDVALRILQDIPGFFRKHWKKFLLGACALILVILAGIVGSFAFQARDPYDEKILNNVMIADVLVGGMTKDQATATLNANLANRYTSQNMVIELGSQTITLSPLDTGAKLNTQAAVEAAYAFGRTGTEVEREAAYQASLAGNYALAVLPYLELNKDYIRSTLEAIETASVSQLTQPSYHLEGEVSSLSTEVFNPAASGQSLVITLGTPQVDFNAEALYNTVLDHYSLAQFRISDPGPVTSQEPGTIDLDAIYQEFFLEPKAPTLDMTDFTAIPGSYGRDFDLGAAKLQLAQAQPGEQLRIPMTYPAPEGDPTSVLYRDVLGESRTALSNDESWNQNLRTACKAIHNITLKPGETFSFNAVLGQLTEDRGYTTAPICANASQGGNIGEGVCQVASTLYVTALLSDLDVTARTAHSAPVSYTDYGMDANAFFGGPDFSFRNNSIYPIRIEAVVDGGYVKTKIIGTDMRSYTVEMEYSIAETIQPKIIYEEFPYDNAEGYEDGDVLLEGINGYQIKTYKRKYDKESKKLLSREFVVTSSYASQDKVIARVAPPVVETEPSTETIPITLPTDPETGEVGEIEAVG